VPKDGPSVAEATRMTTQQLLRAIVFCLLINVGAIAQMKSDLSLQTRARALEPFIVESARRYRIDPRILWTLCFVESRFKPEAISPKGARGPMQFMPDTAARYGLNNPHDPRAAIDAAARYLRDLLNRFGGRTDLALAAYNSGEGTVESYLTGRPLVLRTGKVINPRGTVTNGIPPYEETRNYVSSIITMADRSSMNSTAFRLPSAARNRSSEKLSREPKNKFSDHSSFIDLDQ
jgi:soluble lytic murein transglycosylase-like protein